MLAPITYSRIENDCRTVFPRSVVDRDGDNNPPEAVSGMNCAEKNSANVKSFFLLAITPNSGSSKVSCYCFTVPWS